MLRQLREPVAYNTVSTGCQKNRRQSDSNLIASIAIATGKQPKGQPAPGGRLIGLLIWVALFAGLSMPWLSVEQASASKGLSQIVISEVHYKPDPVTEPIEFVEIHNTGNTPADLSGWLLDGGIQYLFPAGAIIAPNAYAVIAQNSNAFGAMYGQTPAGQFQGKLSNEGERITLRNDRASIVDEISYQLGFPWPTVGTPPSSSIQLIHPSLDNAQPGAWRSAMPSPGGSSTLYADNAPPLIDNQCAVGAGDAGKDRIHIQGA